MGEERLFMEDSLKNQAYREIKQKILTCEYPPGTVLNEAFLCEALSISRTPVRDALSRLEHDHLLQIISKKGIVIESITLSDIGNYFEVLLRLVQTAVRDSGKNADTGELLIFRQFFSDMTHLDDPRKFCGILSSVFGIFIEETGNPYYAQMHQQTEQLEQRLLNLIELSSKALVGFPALCMDFMDTCLSGDYETAAKLAEKLIRMYQDVLTAAFLKRERREGL